MHIKITIQAETTEYSPVPSQTLIDLEALLGIIVPHMLDNVKIEVLVDGLPY